MDKLQEKGKRGEIKLMSNVERELFLLQAWFEDEDVTYWGDKLNLIETDN